MAPPRIAGAPGNFLILDFMLPGVGGLTVVSVSRAREIRTPVLALSALDDLDYSVRAAKRRRSNYLAKPFS